MNQLIQQIEQWANDRNLINGSTPPKQMLKLMEEFGELCAGIAKNKPEMIKDSLGDMGVVLIILHSQLDMQISFDDCIYAAHLKQVDNPRPSVSILYLSKAVGDLAFSFLNTVTKERATACFLPTLTFLIEVCKACRLQFEDCLLHAYNQIKDRKGKMIDGVFVKEEDL